MQQEMGLLGELKTARENLPWEHVAHCDTPQAAARLCLRRARVYRTREVVAEMLGVKRAHFNTMLNSDSGKRVRHMPLELLEDIQDLCGNNAIQQWQELYRTQGLRKQKTKETRKAELLRELEQLEMQQLEAG